MYACFTTCLRFHFPREFNVGSRHVGFFSPTRVGRKGHAPQQCLQWAHVSCEHLGAIHPRWEECPQLKLGSPQPPCSYRSPAPPHPPAVPGSSETRSSRGTSSRRHLHSTPSASPISESEGTLLPVADGHRCGAASQGFCSQAWAPCSLPNPHPHGTHTHTHTQGTPFPCMVLNRSRPRTTPFPS